MGDGLRVREHSRRTEARKSAIPANDAWIAAVAHQHGVPVISRDEHFDFVRNRTRQLVRVVEEFSAKAVALQVSEMPA
jgi:predicted nucleic acid-binding protein